MESDSPAPDNQLERSFVFVLNNMNVEGKMPIEVAPGRFFDRASSEQIVRIKELLKLHTPYGPSAILNLQPYEVNSSRTSGSSGYQLQPLPEDKWRYWVISFEGSNKEISHVEAAASLLKNDLELGFTVLGKESSAGGYIWHGQSLFSFLENQAMGQSPVSVTGDELREIRENYDLIKRISPDHQHITRAFRKVRDLKSLPRKSELVIISLFSIIESLITHSPKLTESADSLMHQIRTKIPLLSKRFRRKLDYVESFDDAKEENIWKKLYEYRSRIVHGEHSDLSGTLQVLKDRETVHEFLKETTKLLLLLALREPTLLTDLKKC